MEKIDIVKNNLKRIVEEKIQKIPIYSWIDNFYDIFTSWDEFFEILKKYDNNVSFNVSDFSNEELKNIEEETIKISIEGLKYRIKEEIEKELQLVERFWIIVDKEGFKLPRFIVYDDSGKNHKDFNVFDCLRAYGLKPDGDEVWEEVARSILYSKENREEWDLDLYATYLEAEDQGLNEVQSCSTKYMDMV
ncbi:hypothetical protein Thena_0560 [Thermodesulfobium narugense DSM 14796]|uniref:Uncharacterized protein n=1 Tax=Thermodesulfobium narugense DSM 14796 TaxID=747365 RepID=M1E6J1_9BACT|nr:hypothetical protein [Thermodesulfobium narugense]AEE14198.1 hypothetical protein Thena_0560 [Thermodesulfobium narugense DSM 14796]